MKEHERSVTHGGKMSRRKQSNPQHITKKSDSEIEAITRSHNVPVELVSVRASERADTEWAVVSVLPLPRGTSFGPFKGAIADEITAEDTKDFLKFPNNSAGEDILVNIEEDTGHWLRLVRVSSTDHNVSIYLQEGNSVWCEITEDIVEEKELVACLKVDPSSSLSQQPNSPPSPVSTSNPIVIKPCSSPVPPAESDASSSTMGSMALPPPPQVQPPVVHHSRSTSPGTSPGSQQSLKAYSSPPKDICQFPPGFPLIHVCLYCGVKFSSPNTLQAHVAFYCAKKPSPEALASLTNNDASKRDQSESEHESVASPTGSLKRKADALIKEENGSDKSMSGSPRSSPMIDPISAAGFHVSTRARTSSPANSHLSPAAALSSHLGDTVSPPPAKVPKMPGLLGCSQCAYTTDKKASLTRHMRLHDERSSSPKERPPLSELYCYECDIQFTSKSTFQGHKDFYCEARRRNQPSRGATAADSPGRVSSSPPTGGSTPSPRAPQIPLIVSSHDAVVSPQRAALMAQAVNSVKTLMQQTLGHQAAVVMAPVVAPNGMTYTIPTVIMQPVTSKTPPPPSIPAAHQSSTSAASSSSTSMTSSKGEQPLDLSVKNKDDEDGEDDKRRLQISPARSINDSPRSTTPRASSNDAVSNSPARSQTSSSPGGVKPTLLPPLPVLPSPILIQPTVPSISKCTDCNIVFYKNENYLAHKEHYCSARRGRPSLAQDDVLSPRPASSSTSRSPPAATSPCPPHSDGLMEPHSFLQYYCVPCKIKFSSVDTLHAHQQFYCPARRQAEAEGEDTYTCPQCHGSYPSARLLKLHYCPTTASSVPMPLFRCPYCEFIAQSDGRLIEHIKQHAPSKAYKCTICGYRGNTVRGMRMHGKMHIDAGEPFTDEHMREFEEPPLIPKRLKPMSDDIESEIMRLKNQPYKRRRSTKMYERMEHMRPQQPLHQCVECNMNFSDQLQLRIHMQEHEESQTFRCKSCEYSTDKKANLVWHVKLVHENPSPSSTITRQEELHNGEVTEDKEVNNADASQSNAEQNGGTNIQVKQEKFDESLTKSPHTNEKDNEKIENGQNENGIKHNIERLCEIDIKTEQTTESNSDTENVGDETASTSRVGPVPPRYQNGNSSRPNTPLSPSPVNINNMKTDLKLNNNLVQFKGELTPEAAILAKKNDKMSPQYCKKCDITFMYAKTFDAHKKYYCRSQPEEKSTTSATEV